jgi:hypothetical protein
MAEKLSSRDCAFCQEPLGKKLKRKNQQYHSERKCKNAFHAAAREYAYDQIRKGKVTKEQLFRYVPASVGWTPPAGFSRSGKRKPPLDL